MEYYILTKNGKVEYKGKEWCNVNAFILGRKSKRDYTLSSISIGGDKAYISHVYDLQYYMELGVKPCRTLVEIPLKDLEMLVKEAKKELITAKKRTKRERPDGNVARGTVMINSVF